MPRYIGLPDGAEPLSRSTVRVLDAVHQHLHYYGHVSINDLVQFLGLSRATIHHHLTRLRSLELIDWVPNEQGTMHVTVRRVDVG